MNPYQEALTWIHKNPGTGSATSLAKLLLSLWNSECGFSFRECVSNLDTNLTKLAVRMVSHFAEHGEDQELVAVGYKVCDAYPRLWELTEAINSATRDQREKWAIQDKVDEAKG